MRRSSMLFLLALSGCAQSAERCAVTLRANSTKAVCDAPAGWESRSPSLIELPVTKIENPSGQSFVVFLYGISSNGDAEMLGNVAVYPPDRTGVFTVRLAGRKTPSRISIEIRRTSEAQPWKPITVSIGPLRWLR